MGLQVHIFMVITMHQ